MKTSSNGFLIVLAFFCLVSCSSVSVTTDYDRTADFSKYKTFAFYELADKSGALSDLNKKRIVGYVKGQMITKGFQESSVNPDVLVNVTAILVNKQSVTANTNVYGYGGYYRPYRWGGGYGGMATTSYDTYNYKDGSLIVDIIDGKSKELVWQGIGNKEIDKPDSDPDKVIAEAVAKIMNDFFMVGPKK
jgi:hypothetical protein